MKRKDISFFSIKLSTICMGFLLFILILPDDAFDILPVYSSITPSSITYIWLSYKFGILQIAIAFIGLYYLVKLNKKIALFVFLLMVLREVSVAIFSENNIFRASAYEVYLSIIVGYSLVLWCEGGLKSLAEYEKFFKLFLLSNVLTVFVNALMGGNTGNIAGRFHASNLDVGGTGVLCVICIIYVAFSDEKNGLIICSL